MSTMHIHAVPPETEQTVEKRIDTGPHVNSATLYRYDDGHITQCQDIIAREEELRLVVRNHSDLVLARTPGDDTALIAGHLFCRSLIRCREDITDLCFAPDGSRAEIALQSLRMLGSSMSVRQESGIDPTRFFSFKKLFEHRQRMFKNTGATHAAALFSSKGEMIAFGEDVGRHNAFDKAIGHALMDSTLHKASVAMLSSRLALELAAKALVAGIPILCGFSAATSSAMDFAQKENITLVGRIREKTLNIYANGWRIQKQSFSTNKTTR